MCLFVLIENVASEYTIGIFCFIVLHNTSNKKNLFFIKYEFNLKNKHVRKLL